MHSIRSKLGAPTRFTRNISTIDRVMTTECVTPQATHARYEGEAQARPSASAVFSPSKALFCCFCPKLWTISLDIVFVALSKKYRQQQKQRRSDKKGGKKRKYHLSFTFFTSGFPVDRLRTCFLLSNESGKNKPRGDVKDTVKRAARIQLGTKGDHPENRAASLFSTCVCGWNVAEFGRLDSHFSGLQRGSGRRPVTSWGLGT